MKKCMKIAKTSNKKISKIDDKKIYISVIFIKKNFLE